MGMAENQDGGLALPGGPCQWWHWGQCLNLGFSSLSAQRCGHHSSPSFFPSPVFPSFPLPSPHLQGLVLPRLA